MLSIADDVHVRFHVYGARNLSPGAVARLVAHALGIRLEVRVGALRGTYHRWSDEAGADVLVQSAGGDDVETSDEGKSCATLVYATALDEAAYVALDRLDELELIDADLVLVP